MQNKAQLSDTLLLTLFYFSRLKKSTAQYLEGTHTVGLIFFIVMMAITVFFITEVSHDVIFIFSFMIALLQEISMLSKINSYY